MAIETTVDYFWQELRFVDALARWIYWGVGAFGVWNYQQGDLSAGAILGLLLYLGLNVALIFMSRADKPALRRYLALVSYVVDLIFASFLVYYTGGLLSQLYLLYCLLPFKAAVYSPYVQRIIFVSFLIFPLHIFTLWLSTGGTIAFLFDEAFLARYALMLSVVFAGMYTAWNLDSRHRQTRNLLEQLEIKHHQVNERRRELRAVLDSIVDGVVVVDSWMNLLMINPVAADMFNLPYPQPPGNSLDELIDNPPLLNLVRQTLDGSAGKDALVSDEIPARPTSSDKPIVCHALATALVSQRDTLHGAVVVLRDMTRQKELDEAKSNFISVLSHELRTPLTTIHGYIELILSGGAGAITAEQQEYLNIALDRSEDLHELINALLEFAQLESSEAHLELSLVSLEKLVYKVLSQVEPLADLNAITLQAYIVPKLKPLYADSQRLERVLLNLMDNAIKFTPAQGQVTVVVSERDSEVLVCVTDTGPGVPPAERERIFERFYQIDDSATREHGGTGLGLAVCKHIVETHHGRIWVENANAQTTHNDGPGSRFCFTLPRDLKDQVS
jgi:signal transduction histidine kinase